jgi:recombination protein RecA
VVEFDIMYGRGISRVGEVLDLAVDANVVQKSGSWYSYDGTKLGQGRDAVKELLEDNPEMLVEMEQRILSKGQEVLAVEPGSVADAEG